MWSVVAAIALVVVLLPSPSGVVGRVTAAADELVSCTPQDSLFVCELTADNPVEVPVTFEQILSAVMAAGGDVAASDPAMWITGWGGRGSDGTRCCGGGPIYPDGGTSGDEGVAQIPVSEATFKKVYGTTELFYAVGKGGPPGPGDSAYGGWGGGATVVSASPPAVSSPGHAPPLWDVVLVAGGSGGGGGGGGGQGGFDGGAGGTAISSFSSEASAPGHAGGDGSSDNGQGGNPPQSDGTPGIGGGGQGGCSDPWCQGADGVGGFGGFGGPGVTNEPTTSLFSPLLTPGYDLASSQTSWAQVTVQSPGMGGGVAELNPIGYLGCGEEPSNSSAFIVCGGAGGGGYGGGGAGDNTSTPDGGFGGGGGGSYAALGTCDAQGGPQVAAGQGESRLLVYVDPDQDCTPSLAALDDRPSQDDAGSAGAPGPSAVLAEVVSPENGSVGPQAARHVVVRTVDGAAITRARLNGRDVTARLGRSGDGTWSGTLNPAEGVVVGENTLVVKAERGSEQWYATTSWVRTSGGQADLVETELDEDSMPLQVLVRHVGDEAVSTTFTLGGSDVPADHVSRELDTERVRLSASSGLRHGSNRLVVSAHTQSGAAQRVVETVRVDNRDPIAGAGPDQRVQVHERAMLDGSSSLPARGGSRADLDLEWEIVSAPPGSQAQVVDIDGAAPQFRPDRPGRFEVQLTVTEPGGRTSTDVATFTVDALPNAMIETLATSGGLPGIKIDSAWFCNDVGTDTTCLFNGNPSQDTTTVQLLVLDSEDLTVVDNRSYDPSSLADFENRIAMLGDNALVVITLASHQAAVTDVTNFSDAVSQIGMPAYDLSVVTSIPGPFSIIGIKGMVAGKAWHNFGHEIGGNKAGSLVGYLKDSAAYTTGGVLVENRVFTFPDVVRFESRVVDDSSVEVQLQQYVPNTQTGMGTYTTTALATFSSDEGSGGGLGIVTFDPYTLAVTGTETWAPDAGAGIDWSGVGAQLQAAVAAGDGVAMVSLGQMSGYSSEPDSADFGQAVLPAIAALGGQPDIFARAVNDNDTYSFIAVGGQGAESSSAVLAPLSSSSTTDTAAQLPVAAGNLTGELQRGNDGRFLPSQADPSGIYESQIDPVIYEAPVKWPRTPGPNATSVDGGQTALAWLAQCGLGTESSPVVPGAALWTGQDCSTDGNQTVTGMPDPAVVRQVALSLRTDYSSDDFKPDLTTEGYSKLFPKGNDVFTEVDFEHASDQLTTELAGLTDVRTFFSILAGAISNSTASLTEQMHQIAVTVQQEYFDQQPTITVTDYGGWAQAMFGGFVTAGATIADLFTDTNVVEDTFETAGLLADVGSFFQTLINGPQTSSFTDIEAWLQLDQQLQDVEVSVDDAVYKSVDLQSAGILMTKDATIADWGRFITVGWNSQHGWAISDDMLSEAANAFVISTRQQIWQGYAHQLWTAGYAPVSSVSGASWPCDPISGVDIPEFPFLFSVESGLPTGLGQGNQYWPLQEITAVAENGARPSPGWRPYLMWEQGPSGQAPPLDALNAIFMAPTGLGASEASAGAYGPWFWPAVFDMTRELSDQCPSGQPQTTQGDFYGQTD